MKRNSDRCRLVTALAPLMLVSCALSTRAGEVQIPNSNFDGSVAGWYWENWSAAGSSTAYNATLNAAGGATPSGSLRLNSSFVPKAGWQEAVYTVPLPAAVNASETYNALSFDVKVDPASTARAEGDYGSIQVILRNGNNWDWAQLGFKPLTGTDWMRVTARFSETTAAIDSVRAITVRVAQNDMLGPVNVNLDNFAFTEEVIADTLDNGVPDTAPARWTWENWSAAGSSVTWDPLDFYGRQTSGSARLVSNFENKPDYQQAVFTYQLPAQENAGTKYSHINLDLKVDPSSIARAGGDYGFFEIILRNGSNWDWVSTGPATTTGTRLAPTTTNWTHISMPVRSGDQVNAITFKLGDGNFLGPVTLRIDNVTWIENTVPPPPPTLTLSKARSGLNLVTTSNDQYGRHNIYSVDGASPGWFDSAEPVSYEFSLLSFPDASKFAGFQAHLFLVPGTPGTATSPDWNEPSLIFLDIKAGAGGTGNATLRWKTNQPAGNSQLYSAGLSNVASATVLGTWKITATQNNRFAVTAPDGTSTQVDLPAAAAAQFAGPIRVYVGVQPNATANIGQSALIGHVKITQGATVQLEDNFTGDALDEGKWVANASAGGVQFLTPAQAGYLVTWGVPDTGFVLQSSPSLTTPAWTDSAATPVNLGPLFRQIHVPKDQLPAGRESYFRLIKPAA